ncbi:MAG TPA: endonuclease/exonuclease/phosphatase family protein [Polyangia bacterium]|nr:endonuclease/exonuclease/phosphatase family protein [Polyangia bacterium]
MPAETLRVVTLNIWNNQGPWPERLRLIRRELGDLLPDIVGLQEVLHLEPSPGQPATPDQAQAIGDGLGYYSAFASAWHIGGGLQFGNALLSRWPIVHADNFQLPCEPDDETRGLLHCVLESPHGRISVFVTHLSWKLHQSDIRQQQVAFIAGKVRDLAPIDEHGFPPILMGDFNAEPESDEIRYLRGYTSRLGRSIYFCDCFAAAGDGSPGYSYARANPYALRAHEPNRRLDYIFSRGPDRALRGEPLSARLCFNQPSDGVWPTDHYGVLAEIQAAPRKHDPL